MYHLEAAPFMNLWKICSLTISSINEFDEHHKWYVMICVEGSSLGLPSNFRIFEGSLEGISYHEGSWLMGSLVNHEKSSKSNIARKGNDANEYWEGGEVSVVPNGSYGPPIFVLMEDWGDLKE
jgi:hypothetical protein